MVNINKSNNDDENEEFKLSPLGTDEINSVIKSFKSSTFHQEELYKKDSKNFVKKTLFDLAKESERISQKDNHNEPDVTSKDNGTEENTDATHEIIKESEQKSEFNDIQFSSELDENNDSKEKEEDDIMRSVNDVIKSEEISEKKISDEKEKSDQIYKENIDQDIKDANENTIDNDSSESNKNEYEEKTLEALDSVREAVTKSLEESSETQIVENKNNNNGSKIGSDDIISEINLINSLFKNIKEISSEEIENVVKSKVIELAETVIGYQIEKFPDKFLKKIKNSINEIKSINTNIKIYLNDKDLELLNKFIESHNTETNFKLDLDSSLGRGDFTIDVGGVVQAIKYKKVID